MHAPVRKKGTGGSLHLGLSCCQLSPDTGPSMIGQTGPLDHGGNGKVSC